MSFQQPNAWTPERLEALEALIVKEALTTKAAAERLGITKNSVIGAITRYAIPAARQPKRKKDAAPPPPPPSPLTFDEPKGCRWIHGEPGSGRPWHYCSAPIRAAGDSWCAAHAAIVWAGPDRNHKQLTAFALKAR